MGYSRHEYPYEGGAQEFAINFPLGYLKAEDITVMVDGEVDGLGNPILRPFEFVGEGTVRVLDALEAPCTVIVQRTVDKTALEAPIDGTAAVTRAAMYRQMIQTMMMMHELLDGRINEFTNSTPLTLDQDAQDAVALIAGQVTQDALTAAGLDNGRGVDIVDDATATDTTWSSQRIVDEQATRDAAALSAYESAGVE